MFYKIRALSKKHKMIRGMVSYAVLWPGSCLMEQTLLEHRTFKEYDWKKCYRYSLFGFFVIAPTMFFWVRLAASMWPKTDFKSSLCKGVTEEIAIDPFGIALFLYTMSRLEGKSSTEATLEVKKKFFEVFRVGLLYWPIVQTVNFMFVPVRNQVVVTSIYSFVWTTFLAYIKSNGENQV